MAPDNTERKWNESVREAKKSGAGKKFQLFLEPQLSADNRQFEHLYSLVGGFRTDAGGLDYAAVLMFLCFALPQRQRTIIEFLVKAREVERIKLEAKQKVADAD